MLDTLLFANGRGQETTLYSRIFLTVDGPIEHVQMQRAAETFYISTAGSTQSNVMSPLMSYQVNQLFETVQLTEYRDEQSILSSFFSRERSVVRPMFMSSDINPNAMQYPFFIYRNAFPAKIDVYRRYPDQLTTTLAKVGGLLALLKIFSYGLRVYHRKAFEEEFSRMADLEYQNSIQESFSIQREQRKIPYKEWFSFANLKESLEKQGFTADVETLAEQVSDLKSQFEKQKSQDQATIAALREALDRKEEAEARLTEQVNSLLRQSQQSQSWYESRLYELGSQQSQMQIELTAIKFKVN